MMEMGVSDVVMVTKLKYQTNTSEYESQRVFHSYGLVPHLSKSFTKFSQLIEI